MATASGNIRGVPDLLRVLSGIPLNRTHAHLRYWFRGQPKSGLPLQPGVYRSTFGSYANEEDRFTKEKHLNQDFKVLSAGLRTGRETMQTSTSFNNTIACRPDCWIGLPIHWPLCTSRALAMKMKMGNYLLLMFTGFRPLELLRQGTRNLQAP